MTAHFPRVSNHLAERGINCFKTTYTHAQEIQLLLVEFALGPPRLALTLREYPTATYVQISIFPKTRQLHPRLKCFKLLSFNSFPKSMDLTNPVV